MKDSVKLYQRARALLQSEKAALTKALIAAQSKAADAKKRLAEIVAALSGTGSAPVERLGRPKKKSAKRGRPAKKKSAKRGRPAKKNSAKKAVKKAPAKKAKNERSLKEVVLEVTKGKALNAAEIVNAAEKAGHKFSGNNPKNSLRVMLYSNRKLFKNNKGKFTAA